MSFSNTKELIVVEVHWLDDVRSDFRLRTPAAEAVFRSLAFSAATEVVAEHFMRDVRMGGRCFDGPDDDEGDGARLHVFLTRKGRVYSLLIVRFDFETRNPPVISDGMAVVYGDRSLLWKVIAYQGPDNRAIEIELVPLGCQSDEPRVSLQPPRPAVPVKPVYHRIAVAAVRWWVRLRLRIGEGQKALSRALGMLLSGTRVRALALVVDDHASTEKRKSRGGIFSQFSVAAKRISLRLGWPTHQSTPPLESGRPETRHFILSSPAIRDELTPLANLHEISLVGDALPSIHSAPTLFADAPAEGLRPASSQPPPH